MVEMKNRMREQRLTVVRLAPPRWFGWAGVLSMFLLAVVRIRVDDNDWFFPLLSFGEWLLLPLGAASLTMGLLVLGKRKERTLLPFWISSVLPGLLWIAGAGLSIIMNGVTPEAGDMVLSWAVHLVFPAMAFLPLLAQPDWRDRIMWALAAGVAVNIAAIIWQGRATGFAPPDPATLGLGGLLPHQGDYSLFAGIAVPLIAAWRGGNVSNGRRALATLFCTFLLPALALGTCFSWAGVVAVAVGLACSWASWRSYAFILGLFLCVLIFGYGSEARKDRDASKRRLFAESTAMGSACYEQAFASFETNPYFGSGPDTFREKAGCGDDPHAHPVPWYASLLGGTGLVGAALWIVLLAELGARAMGRYGKPCMFHGGVLGATAAIAAASLWTDALPQGAGALVGFLLAVSIYDKSEPALEPPRRSGKTQIIPRREDKMEIKLERPASKSGRHGTPSSRGNRSDTIIKL